MTNAQRARELAEKVMDMLESGQKFSTAYLRRQLEGTLDVMDRKEKEAISSLDDKP